MTVYLVIRIKDLGVDFTTDTMGVYEDEDEACEWMEKLEKLNPELDVIFDVIEFELNDQPVIFDFMVEQRESLIDTMNDTLISLMKKELIEQYVGEDGVFYYELTKKGKSTMKNVPGKILKKFLERGK